MTEAVIALKDVSLTLGEGASSVHVLKGVSLEVARGEATGIVARHLEADALEHMDRRSALAERQGYVFQRDDGFCQNESVLYGA